MRRIVTTVVAVVLAVVAGLVIGRFTGDDRLYNPPPAPSTVVPNGSTDGRFHTCGYVTEEGVTEHLDAYAERCGD